MNAIMVVCLHGCAFVKCDVFLQGDDFGKMGIVGKQKIEFRTLVRTICFKNWWGVSFWLSFESVSIQCKK